MASLNSCSSCGRSEGTKWTLDEFGEVWEWCPDCSQQLELLACGTIDAHLDEPSSVSASTDDGRSMNSGLTKLVIDIDHLLNSVEVT